VDHGRNGFNPSTILTDFDAGEVGTLPTGQTVHTYRFVAVAKTIEIAPGVMFPAWTYNGRIPGPTIRVRQGDRVRIAFTNATDHHHGLHFHGIHPGSMDGAIAQVPPGGTFTYEFDAEPFGVAGHPGLRHSPGGRAARAVGKPPLARGGDGATRCLAGGRGAAA
jgi:hypothetical protein